jgi:hypothetical protein
MQKVQIDRDGAVQHRFGEIDLIMVPENRHGWLMSMNDVANGYGVARNTIQSAKANHSDELVEDVHFVFRVGVSDTKATREMIYWTKAGIVRLGFFIKSERAKAFRDWAEQVVLALSAPKVELPKSIRSQHNRLTKDRMVEILAVVALVDNKEVRKALVQKLLPDVDLPGIQMQLPLEAAKGGTSL